MNIFARTQEVCSRYLCGWAFDVSLDGYHFVPKTAAGDHVIPTQNYPKKPTDERCTVCDQYENSHRHSIGWKHRHDFSPPPAKEKQPYLSGHNMPHEAMGPTVQFEDFSNFNRERWMDYVAGNCGPNGGQR